MVSQGGATSIVLHKGAVPYSHRSYGRDIGLILHLSASTNLGAWANHKVLVATVDEAIKIGADAVSVHVNLGNEDEPAMLRDIGQVSRTCAEWGMPLLVMIYPRGKDIKYAYDVELLKQCARVATELGADIVKTNYTGDIDSFREVVAGRSGASGHRRRAEDGLGREAPADGEGLHRGRREGREHRPQRLPAPERGRDHPGHLLHRPGRHGGRGSPEVPKVIKCLRPRSYGSGPTTCPPTTRGRRSCPAPWRPATWRSSYARRTPELRRLGRLRRHRAEGTSIFLDEEKVGEMVQIRSNEDLAKASALKGQGGQRPHRGQGLEGHTAGEPDRRVPGLEHRG